MPANLPPQYFQVHERLKTAATDEEKIAIYEELLTIVPKHKGTEKIQKELKSKISKIKKESQSGGKKGPARFSFHIPKEGAGQVALIGPTNTGKSSIFKELTGLDTEIADFAYTTRDYKVGMMRFENVLIQLIDTPPFMEDFYDKWLPSVVKLADLTLCVFDPSSDDLLDQFELVRSRLDEKNVDITRTKGDSFHPNIVFIGNKDDADGYESNLGVFKEFYPTMEIIPMNTIEDAKLSGLKQFIYDKLSIIRVYCKPQGKDPDFNSPVVLKAGSDIMDFAKDLGKQFVEKFRQAKLINKQNPQGILVAKDYRLLEGDVVEIYISD